METCFKCGRNDSEIRLFDGIYINESVKTCERCSLIEGIPIIKMPNIGQLKSSESSDYVYKRLKKISGFKDEKPKKSIFEELKESEKINKISKKEEAPIKLVNNFHWIIQHERRRRGLTHKQLSESIGESETALKLLERNNPPENMLPLLKKLEQYLRIKLIISPAYERPLIERRPDSIVVEREFESRSEFPEAKPGFFRIKEGKSALQKTREKEPIEILNFKKDSIKNITISDLKEFQRRIEKDFPNKTSAEIGREQLEDFGKSEKTTISDTFKKSWSSDYLKKKSSQIYAMEKEKIPSISELAEKKKTAKLKGSPNDLFGNEIDLIDDAKNSDSSIKNSKKDIDLIEFDG